MTDDAIDEKEVLASFISILPEAILMCDPNGICLVHDRQSQRFLAPGAAGTDPSTMKGRPVTAFIDKHLVEHALDDIKERLARGAARPVSGFMLKRSPGCSRPGWCRCSPVPAFLAVFSSFSRISPTRMRQKSGWRTC